MKEKVCSKCLLKLSIDEFYKRPKLKSGFSKICKKCLLDYNKQYKSINKEYTKNYSKKYKLKNKEKHAKSAREYRLKNIEKLKEKSKIRWEKNKNNPEYKKRKAAYDKEYSLKNKDKINKRQKIYVAKNKDTLRPKVNAARRRRRKLNPVVRIKNSMSCNIRDGLRGRKSGKSWKSLVDYTVQDLIIHLESKFTKGMTWENYGKTGWEIDHIIPQSFFSYDSYNHPAFRACWALSNLQPLWATTEIAISYGEGTDYIGNLDKRDNVILTQDITEYLNKINNPEL